MRSNLTLRVETGAALIGAPYSVPPASDVTRRFVGVFTPRQGRCKSICNCLSYVAERCFISATASGTATGSMKSPASIDDAPIMCVLFIFDLRPPPKLLTLPSHALHSLLEVKCAAGLRSYARRNCLMTDAHAGFINGMLPAAVAARMLVYVAVHSIHIVGVRLSLIIRPPHLSSRQYLKRPSWNPHGLPNCPPLCTGGRCLKKKEPLVGWDDCAEWSKLKNVGERLCKLR